MIAAAATVALGLTAATAIAALLIVAGAARTERAHRAYMENVWREKPYSAVCPDCGHIVGHHRTARSALEALERHRVDAARELLSH